MARTLDQAVPGVGGESPALPARWRWIAGMVALVLAVPPVIYGVLAWRQAGFLSPSYYIPFEELQGAVAAGDFGLLLVTSLVTVNMTSGDILANMYQLTVEQFLLSAALGVAVGLTLDAQVRLRRACPRPGAVGGTAAAAGSGLMATVAASSTGILGCCGAGLGGGVLALMGVTSSTAAQMADWSPYVQMALIALFALAYRRFARRLKTIAPAAWLRPATGF